MRASRIAILMTLIVLPVIWLVPEGQAAATMTSASTAPRSAIVRVGHARFEVLTPTLIRMEYAQDGRFTDAATQFATRARLPVPAYTTSIRNGVLTIRTAQAALRYRLGSGPFSAQNLTIAYRMDNRTATAAPTPSTGLGNLGGWTRALDNESGPVPLHPGILSTKGFSIVDDSATVLTNPGSSTFRPRPTHVGAYDDWYLFVYGHNYQTALGDLRAVSGPSPLLPKSAFGVWFSRYYPYSPSDYVTLLKQFRSARVPLDTLSVDTDFKRVADPVTSSIAGVLAGAPGKPFSWNGWEWNTKLFPNPQGFIDWAHANGLSLAINIHPTIDTNDPQYRSTVAKAGPLTPDNGMCKLTQADLTGTCMTFNWGNPKQLAAYFDLHQPFAAQGIDMFWLDWCCDGPQKIQAGLTWDTWINSQYFNEQKARGQRWPAFSRVGGAFIEKNANGPDNDRAAYGTGALAEHRTTIQFTGDTCATWQMLAFESQLTAAEGSIGLPYVSHDIGSYNGPPGKQACGSNDIALTSSANAAHHLPDDMYARWVQLGTFQPLDRLHSNHGDRLPWEYNAAANASASAFLRLREALIPYAYTLAREAYDTGIPMVRALYIPWPNQAGAYRHNTEYAYGPDMVVQPVTAPGTVAKATMWVPPGTWIDYFTGKSYTGARTITLNVPLNQMPVLVRAGSALVTQAYLPHTPDGPNPHLIVNVYPGRAGTFQLYDDQGTGFGYQRGQYAFTAISNRQTSRSTTVVIGAERGSFPGKLKRRDWTVRLLGKKRPMAVQIKGGAGAYRSVRWSYDARTRTIVVNTGLVSTSVPVVVRVTSRR